MTCYALLATTAYGRGQPAALQHAIGRLSDGWALETARARLFCRAGGAGAEARLESAARRWENQHNAHTSTPRRKKRPVCWAAKGPAARKVVPLSTPGDYRPNPAFGQCDPIKRCRSLSTVAAAEARCDALGDACGGFLFVSAAVQRARDGHWIASAYLCRPRSFVATIPTNSSAIGYLRAGQ
eukprot:3709756-Prymnesium_polylepis.3